MNNYNKNIRPISYRQLRAVEFWLNYGRKNKAHALRLAGYGKSVIRQPHKVFNSPIVRFELEVRGYGSRGVLNNQKPQKSLSYEAKPVTRIDFSKITKESLQDLKDKLRSV